MKKLLLVALAALILPWQVAHAQPSWAQTPIITLSSPVVSPGSTVNIYGKYFPPNAACNLSINTQPVTLSSTTLAADTGGNFSTTLTIPSNTQPGAYTVSGGCSGATAPALTLTVSTPQATFVPTSVSPGNPITINGKGFAGNTDLAVAVTLNIAGGGTSPFSQVIHTASDGSFTGVTINVPSTAINGSYPITFSQGGSTVLATNLIVGQATTLNLSPSNVAAGTYTTFQASGTNFLVGERVDVSYTQNQSNGSTQVITGSGTADSTGSINHVLLSVPSNTVPGTYTVTATGANSHRVASAQLVVRPPATLSVTPSAVPAGATVVVHGQNFPPGATVTLVSAISQKDGSVANQTVTATADGNGSFSAAFSLPAGTASGPVHIVATAPGPQSTQLTASADVNVTLLRPSVQVAPSTAAPGSVIAVTATGFLPGAAVTVSTQVTANGAQQTLAQTVPADTAGVAQAFLTLPTGTNAGTTVVTASQPAGAASASANLTIQAPVQPAATATPSPTPTPFPTATSTPVPSPTARPALAFASIRTQRHVARGGQMNRIDAQANQAQVLTIWAHINYPNGRHIDYNSKTDSSGHWTKQFRVLSGTTNQYSRRVYIHLQLWRGKETVKTFGSFLIKS